MSCLLGHVPPVRQLLGLPAKHSRWFLFVSVFLVSLCLCLFYMCSFVPLCFAEKSVGKMNMTRLLILLTMELQWLLALLLLTLPQETLRVPCPLDCHGNGLQMLWLAFEISVRVLV